MLLVNFVYNTISARESPTTIMINIKKIMLEEKKLMNTLDTTVKKLEQTISAVVVYTDNDMNRFEYFSNNQALLEAVQNNLDANQLSSVFVNERRELGLLLSLPEQPIEALTHEVLKAFTVLMMYQYACLSKKPQGKPGYNKPEMKPIWWPIGVIWQANAIQLVNLAGLKDIVRACFRHFEVQSELIAPSNPDGGPDSPASSLSDSDEQDRSSFATPHTENEDDEPFNSDMSQDSPANSSNSSDDSQISDDCSEVSEQHTGNGADAGSVSSWVDVSDHSIACENLADQSNSIEDLANNSGLGYEADRSIFSGNMVVLDNAAHLTVLTNVADQSYSCDNLQTEAANAADLIISYPPINNVAEIVIDHSKDLVLVLETSAPPRKFMPPVASERKIMANILGLRPGKPGRRFGNRADVLSEPKTRESTDKDGNCFFSCINFILTGEMEEHMTVRTKIVEHMSTIIKKLEKYSGKCLTEEYLAHMRSRSIWATDVEIVATANLLGHDIVSYTKRGDSKVWLTYPAKFSLDLDKLSKVALYIDHVDESHYVVVKTVFGIL